MIVSNRLTAVTTTLPLLALQALPLFPHSIPGLLSGDIFVQNQLKVLRSALCRQDSDGLPEVSVCSTYRSIRQYDNISLVAGSGFGSADVVWEYLTSDWSVKCFGVQPMSLDGLVC